MSHAYLIRTGLLAFSLLAGPTLAAVSQQEADRLGADLTPVGAEMVGNADGSIPAWTGGIPKDAATIDANGYLGDPFAGEKPSFVITAQNVSQYADKLSPGQQAMFKRYPQSYRIPVYPTHRSVRYSAERYAKFKVCATQVSTVDDGNGLSNYSQCRSLPFPIPKAGVEVIWNHMMRRLPYNVERHIVQAVPQVNGSYTLIRMRDHFVSPELVAGFDLQKNPNLSGFFKQVVISPARLSGTSFLSHASVNGVLQPNMTWAYNSGQRRVRRAPQVGYDGPGTAADGMRTADNLDLYSSPPDRYDWKIIGKQEMYIPYNGYHLASPDLKYADIIKAGHINQDLTRYELHRVWHVQANLKPGERHIYAKRDFFVDEDSWSIAEVDHYDARGQLWRVGEGFTIFHYGEQLAGYLPEVIYDLQSGRYSVLGLNNEEGHGFNFSKATTMNDWKPSALRQEGVR